MNESNGMTGENSGELILFESESEGFQLKVDSNQGDDIWMTAFDVCQGLGVSSVARALSRLDDDEKAMRIAHTPGGPQYVSFVNEAGLYSLVMTSRKPEAKRFKRWVTHEVLPAIRKTGMYIADNMPRPGDSQLVATAKMFNQVVQEIEELRKRVNEADSKILDLDSRIEEVNSTAKAAAIWNLTLMPDLYRMDNIQSALDYARGSSQVGPGGPMLISAGELSRRTSIPLASVYSQGRSGKIPGRVTNGRSVHFNWAVVKNWIDRQAMRADPRGN